jgi:hypothetical protein
MIVDDNLFQELLDRVAALEYKVGVIENRLNPGEGTRQASPGLDEDWAGEEGSLMRDKISQKIELVRCDLHRHCAMRPITIHSVSPTADINDMDALRCESPGCVRHYRTDFGYFYQAIGDSPDMGFGKPKERCGKHTDTPCLFVEWMGCNEWRLSCPIDGCDTQQPLEP